MKLLDPKPLPFDFKAWKEKPFGQRCQMLCEAWALQGYGSPPSVYLFYILKMGLYIGLWLFFCSFSTELGSPSEIGTWWFASEALLKAILWSILFEGMGLGSGSGPLTGRYFPPVAAVAHFVRPGTIKLPLFPKLPLIGGDKRNVVDVLIYITHIGFLIRALIAPEVTPELLLPSVILLPLLGVLDRTIFLSARAEHYFIAMLCFMFPEEALAGAKWVWWGVWFWAATSKLNQHFPSVIGVMLSNSAIIQSIWLRKRLYKSYPKDLRPSKFAAFLAHSGTILEYAFPILLILGGGGSLTQFALIAMLLFHVFITGNIPMGVPIEWNVIMVYGGFVLFGGHAELALLSLQSPILIAALLTGLFILPLVGNVWPQYVSFLLSMRYYAGNWAYSVWLFKGETEEKLDENLIKTSKTLMKQLAPFYDELTAESLVSKVTGFRMMHLHGRALQLLVPQAVENINDYLWRDGELVAGVALGWNFGDGHLHHELLLEAIQKRCQYAPSELRCIFVESQPMGRPHLDWRIVDAADGELHAGRIQIKELRKLQPYPPH
ncbi:MAG: DUF3556 domain-containing protein [Bacteroidia bacterium]